MTITIRCFAGLRDCASADGRRVNLADGATAAEAWAALVRAFPALEPWGTCVRPAVNRAYVPWRTALHHGDELALIPPVSGG